MRRQRSKQPLPMRNLLVRGGLACIVMLAIGMWLQSRSAPTYASQLTQLVAATPTPLSTQIGELLFITAGGGAELTTLTRLSPSTLRDTSSLNDMDRGNSVGPIGQSAIIPPGCEATGMQAAPRGPWVAVELACVGGEASAVQLHHAQTGEVKSVGRQFGSQVVFLGWSPNGQHVILLKDALSDAGAVLVSVADGSVTPLNVPGDVYNLALSHDGTRMVYSLTRGLGFGSETWVANIDGSSPHLLSADPKHIVAYARFSPNNQQIAFIRMPDSNIPFTIGELWAMNADGNNPRLLGQADAGHGYAPAWSPDGSRIAYVFRENGGNVIADQIADRLTSNIYIADILTGFVLSATAFTSTLVEAPVWSPDGAQLAFAALPGDGGVSDVWLYTPASNAATRVTQNLDSRYPVFTSDR